MGNSYTPQVSYGDWQLQNTADGALYINSATGEQMSQAQYNNMRSQERNAAAMRAQGLNPDGSPIKKEFESLIDPETGKLKDAYQLHLDQLDPSSLQGYNMIKSLATQQGPTQSAQYLMDKARMGREDTIDAATKQNAGAQAQMLSQLASRGGVSSGARERLAMQGGRDLLSQKQSAYRQNTGNLLDILKQDEDTKRQALSQFAEGEGKIATGNLAIRNQELSSNLTNTLKEKDLSRQADMEAYKAALDKWAAGKQADATARSGGGGGK